MPTLFDNDTSTSYVVLIDNGLDHNHFHYVKIKQTKLSQLKRNLRLYTSIRWLIGEIT